MFEMSLRTGGAEGDQHVEEVGDVHATISVGIEYAVALRKGTTAIIVGRFSIVVVRFIISAPPHAGLITLAIAVEIKQAIARAILPGLSKDTGPVFFGSGGLEVARCGISAPFYFVLVAGAITIAVVLTRTVTIEMCGAE